MRPDSNVPNTVEGASMLNVELGAKLPTTFPAAMMPCAIADDSCRRLRNIQEFARSGAQYVAVTKYCATKRCI
jgi:hypothetical protein